MTDADRSTQSELSTEAFERAPDMHCLVDLESGAIIACNRVFAEKLGRDQEELVGRPVLELYHPDFRPEVREAWERLETDDRVENVDVQMVRADGEVFDVSLSATTLDAEGGQRRIHSVLRDISELKETERKLRSLTDQLRKSNKELEQFAYLASHDLQEPLRMVASYTQLLARRYEGELDERADKYIGYAVEGAERMKRLLNDLLAYSRLGGTEAGAETVEIDRILQEVTGNLALQIEDAGAEVVWEPPSPKVHGNPTQLLQLFQNLVENGIKFCNGGTPRVEITATRVDETVRVGVSDNGIGFDPANADRIFKIFQRLHKRGEYDGTGAGLAVVKKVVEAHDGSISVDSTEGEGTTFVVELPAA